MDLAAWQRIRETADKVEELEKVLVRHTGPTNSELKKLIEDLEARFSNEIQGLKMRIGKVKPGG